MVLFFIARQITQGLLNFGFAAESNGFAELAEVDAFAEGFMSPLGLWDRGFVETFSPFLDLDLFEDMLLN